MMSRILFLLVIPMLFAASAFAAPEPGQNMETERAAYTLPELKVDNKRYDVLHLLGYVREYSTLTTFTDTVLLFREKTVDFMVPTRRIRHFDGWTQPRVLASESYYHFTDYYGLDSVSDRFDQHFSWSDWVGIPDYAKMPEKLRTSVASDTVRGKFGPTAIWQRNEEAVRIDVNVLQDTLNYKWTPALARFITDEVDFSDIRVRYNYDNVLGDDLWARDLSWMSFDIESRGRGRRLRHELRNYSNEDCRVNTYGEIYIADREYITLAEAKKWDRIAPRGNEIGILRPDGIPALDPKIASLVARVDSLDHGALRLNGEVDRKVAGRNISDAPVSKTKRLLRSLKSLIGL